MIFTKWYYGLFNAYVFLGTSHIMSGRFHIHFLRIMLQNKRVTTGILSLAIVGTPEREAGCAHSTPNYGPG